MAIGVLIFAALRTYSHIQMKRVWSRRSAIILFFHTACRHWDDRHDVCCHRAQSCTDDTHIKDVYKEVVERHIEATHHDGECTRHAHLSRTLQHRTHEMIGEDGGKRETKDEEISRRHRGDVCLATEPIGEWVVDGYADKCHEDAEGDAADEGMTENLTGTDEVVGADEMSHLYGKAYRHCRG